MDYYDPKGFQGNINTLDIFSRSRLSTIASDCSAMVSSAIQYEQNYQTETAINKCPRIHFHNGITSMVPKSSVIVSDSS